MNIRKALFFSYKRMTGSKFPSMYEDLVRQDQEGVAPDTTKQLLIKKSEQSYEPEELIDIKSKAQKLMGKDCQVDFEFVDNIPASPSGKFRYILSEIHV